MPYKDPKVRAAYNKAYRERNKEKLRAKDREYKRRRRATKKGQAKEKIYRENGKETRREYLRGWVKTPTGRKYKAKKERRNRLKQYDLTIESYNALLANQGHECACCGVHQDEVTNNLCVDHDHTSGAVRGLLCNKCNSGIGLLGDSVEGVRKALKYLESHYNEDKRSRKKAGSGVRGIPSRTPRRKMCSVPRQASGEEVLAAG